MKLSGRVMFLTALALGSMAAAGGAGAERSRIDDLHLGEYWYGARVDVAGLRGKVVLVELWGS